MQAGPGRPLPGPGVRRRSFERNPRQPNGDQKDRKVQAGPHPQGAEQPQVRQQHKPRSQGPEHRADRVDAVQQADARADLPIFGYGVLGQQRQGGAHGPGGHGKNQKGGGQIIERLADAGIRRRRRLAAVKEDEQCLGRVQQQGDQQGGTADHGFQNPIDEQRPAHPGRHPGGQRRAQGQPRHVGGQHGRHRHMGGAERHGELFQPSGLIQQRREAGQQEASGHRKQRRTARSEPFRGG